MIDRSEPPAPPTSPPHTARRPRRAEENARSASQPELKLYGELFPIANHSAVPVVVLVSGSRQEIPADVDADTRFRAADGRVPCVRPERRCHTAEGQPVRACCDEQTRPHFVTGFHE